ncbi:peroxidase-related enzyme [Acidisoma sp. S159]|jgi:uncharacterized peroxidase-related enzyme|uniref:peroxidase-related enzyme n=1 Tax=Acidisoma sp. S159 TaxID=1747225 RepID=UPI00131E5379|nr:peroxidase-related enzyme [Acidisoma sp. S159]
MPDTHLAPAAEAIARVHLPRLGAEPENIRALIERHAGENWVRTLALNPDTARRFASYFEDLFRVNGARLPLHERELIAVAVSATNGCGLCEIHHTIALGEALGDAVRARRIALDLHLAVLSPRERALVEFAVKVTKTPKQIDESVFHNLRAAGLDDADIIEALEVSAWFNHTNRIFIALGVQPDEKYFFRDAQDAQ